MSATRRMPGALAFPLFPWRAGLLLLLFVAAPCHAMEVPPVIVIDDRRVFEGNGGATQALFTVSLSHPAVSPVTVDYATADGTAKTSDNDYAAASGTVTFDPGQTSRPIVLTVNGDPAVEADETFSVSLSNPAGGGGATLADAAGAGTILDEDRATLLCPDLFVTDGDVRDIVESNGTLYVGGRFSYAGPMTGHGVPVDATSGEAVSGFPLVDGVVTEVVSDGSGGWFIAGFFRSVGGTERLNLAHIRSDNTVSNWDPNPNGSVTALTLVGGILYVGGSFTSIGGENRNRIAAVDPITGQATAWNPNANSSIVCIAPNGGTIFVGGTFTTLGGQARNRIAALDAATGSVLAWNPNASGFVDALVPSGATVYAGGDFTIIGGQARNRIAALDAVSGIATAWDPNSNGRIQALVVDGGTVYAGGSFQTIGGQTRRYIAGLSAATGLATAWNPNANNPVNSLLLSGTTLYVTGDFTQIGSHERRSLAALDIASGIATPWNPNPNYTVRAVASAGATVYVAGSMTSLGGETRNNLAAFDRSTGAMTPWNPNVQGFNVIVEAMAVAGNTVYVGGTFTDIGSSPISNLAAVDATTGLSLNTWSGDATNAVASMALSGGTLYVGGAFTQVGGQDRNYIAALDAATGLAMNWNASATGITSGIVRTIVVDGSTIYVGGRFQTMGGQPRSNIAALDAATALATAWDPGTPNDIHVLAVDGGTVYAGGDFASIGGESRSNLAAVDAVTGLVTSWDPDVPGDVDALALGSGVIHVGGTFSQVGDQARRNLAAVDLQTGLPTSWSPGPNSGGDVNALLAVGGDIYAGGDFTSMAGQPRSGIACLGSDPVSAAPPDPSPIGFELAVRHGFRDAVQISYTLPEPARARVSIFDVQGRLVARPVDESRPAGVHELSWGGPSAANPVASGLYFIRLEAAGREATTRFFLIH